MQLGQRDKLIQRVHEALPILHHQEQPFNPEQLALDLPGHLTFLQPRALLLLQEQLEQEVQIAILEAQEVHIHQLTIIVHKIKPHHVVPTIDLPEHLVQVALHTTKAHKRATHVAAELRHTKVVAIKVLAATVRAALVTEAQTISQEVHLQDLLVHHTALDQAVDQVAHLAILDRAVDHPALLVTLGPAVDLAQVAVVVEAAEAVAEVAVEAAVQEAVVVVVDNLPH